MGALCRVILLLAVAAAIAACGEKDVTQAPAGQVSKAAGPGAGSGQKVAVAILPDNPTATDCLQLSIKGQPGSSRITWQVNAQPVQAGDSGSLCGVFKRGDQVTGTVGTVEAGGSASVTIANTPPRVVGISATPKDWRSGMQVKVFPVGEDADGDPVEFRYQWLINDEVDPQLTSSDLPAERNRRGDRVQVLITPFDGTDEGPVYRSYAMPVPGAPPKIISKPPASFEALEYSYQVKVQDPDNDRLSFSLETPPSGMTISRGGKITWPLSGVQPGKYEVKILVRDPEGGEDRQEFVLTLGEPKGQ